MLNPVRVPRASASYQALVERTETARSQAIQAALDASAQLVLVNQGGAAALAALGLAGQAQAAAVTLAGASALTVVNEAAAAAGGAAAAVVVGQLQPYVTAAQAARNAAQAALSETQAFRNDAQTFAQQAQFSGYAGTHATRGALVGASGKLAGYHLVRMDETHGGQAWVYLVAGGSISGGGHGTFVAGATGTLTLAAALVNSASGNRNVLEIAMDDPQGGPFVLTKYTGPQQHVAGRRDEVLALGYNVNPGAGRLDATKHAFSDRWETLFYPFAGKRWAERHWEMTFENGLVSRPISMEADVDRTDGSNASGKYLRMRIEGDIINFTTPGNQNGQIATLQRGGMLMEAGGYDTFLSSGTVLSGRTAAGGYLPLVGLDNTRPDGVVFLGNTEIPTWVPRSLLVGDPARGGSASPLLSVLAAQDGTPAIARFLGGGGNHRDGVTLQYGGAGVTSEFVADNSGGSGEVRWRLSRGGAMSEAMHLRYDRRLELMRPEAGVPSGIILASQNGTRYLYAPDDAGVLQPSAAPVYA